MIIVIIDENVTHLELEKKKEVVCHLKYFKRKFP